MNKSEVRDEASLRNYLLMADLRVSLGILDAGGTNLDVPGKSYLLGLAVGVYHSEQVLGLLKCLFDQALTSVKKLADITTIHSTGDC